MFVASQSSRQARKLAMMGYVTPRTRATAVVWFVPLVLVMCFEASFRPNEGRVLRDDGCSSVNKGLPIASHLAEILVSIE